MKKNTIFYLLAFMFFIFPVRSAVVVLNSGEEIEGLIAERGQDRIKIYVNGESRIYRHEDIKQIKGRKPELASMQTAAQECATVVADGFQEGQAAFDVGARFKTLLDAAGLGNFSKARSLALDILEHNPDNVYAQEAVSMFDAQARGDVDSSYVMAFSRGSYYLLEGKYENAAAFFKRALQYGGADNNNSIYYNLGYIYLELEKYEAAAECFRKVVDYDTQDIEALYLLGKSLYLFGSYEQAISCFKGVVDAVPDDADSYMYLGVSHFLTGCYEEGSRFLDKSRDLYYAQKDIPNMRAVESLVDKLSSVYRRDAEIDRMLDEISR